MGETRRIRMRRLPDLRARFGPLGWKQRGTMHEEVAMTGLPTILLLIAVRIVLPILALLAAGTILERRSAAAPRK